MSAHYHGEEKKRELENRELDALAVIGDIDREGIRPLPSVKKAEKKRYSAPPFTTSTLQQEASRKLNMTPKWTMAVAQQLYEGVDVAGEGTTGLITYMRTDSLRLSDEAMARCGGLYPQPLRKCAIITASTTRSRRRQRRAGRPRSHPAQPMWSWTRRPVRAEPDAGPVPAL